MPAANTAPFALQGICSHGNDRPVEKRSL
jgi:hypothetical protein